MVVSQGIEGKAIGQPSQLCHFLLESRWSGIAKVFRMEMSSKHVPWVKKQVFVFLTYHVNQLGVLQTLSIAIRQFSETFSIGQYEHHSSVTSLLNQEGELTRSFQVGG